MLYVHTLSLIWGGDDGGKRNTIVLRELRRSVSRVRSVWALAAVSTLAPKLAKKLNTFFLR